MKSMPDSLYAHGDATTRKLHWWYGHEVLISDDKSHLLRLIGNTFGQACDRYIIEATPEDLRRLILEQWGEGIRYIGFAESPPLRPTVRIHGDAAMDYSTRIALRDYLTRTSSSGEKGLHRLSGPKTSDEGHRVGPRTGTQRWTEHHRRRSAGYTQTARRGANPG